MMHVRVPSPIGAVRSVVCSLLVLATSVAFGATITVNSTADVAANDGQCTLREAMTAANANAASGAAAGECAAGEAFPIVDIIAFNIAAAGVQTITPLSGLPTITEVVTINGYTQPGSSANTNPMNAGINAVLLIEIDNSSPSVFRANANGTTIRGLVINRGVDNIKVNADNVTIAGNFIGVNAAGTAAAGNAFGGFGVRHETGNNMTVGGAAAADRNLISGNSQGGIIIDLGFPTTYTGHLVEGNYIGPDVTGMLSLIGPNAVGMVNINNALVRGNLISGNANGGIDVSQQTGNGLVVIHGNLIGTQRDGTSPLGNGGINFAYGVLLRSSNNTVGGSGAGEPNTIAYNVGAGVGVFDNTENNPILQNSIHSNGLLGISLKTQNPGAVLANDAGDADTLFGNNGQNYPVLSAVSLNGGNVLISGSLNSTASTTFRLEFFANAACDPSGNGEGQTYLGSSPVTTDAGGNVSFSNLSFTAAGGSVITATATRTTTVGLFVADTSEFSACLAAVVPPDLTISKTHSGNFVQGSAGNNYTVIVTNSGAGDKLAGQLVSVTDPLPAGLTATAISGTGWTCTTLPTTCTRSDLLAAGNSYQSITVTVSVALDAASQLLNVAAVATAQGESDDGNNAATDPTIVTAAVPPDLTLTKTHSGNFVQGSTGNNYTLIVTNSGAGDKLAGQLVSVTDAPPSGLTVTAMSGSGWTCTVLPTCTRSDLLASGNSYSSITVTVSVALSATSPQVNSVSVATAQAESNTGNNTATDSTVITAAPQPDLTLTKTHGGNFVLGSTGNSYTVIVTNSGAGAKVAGQLVSVTDAPPSGLTVTAMSGSGWTCTTLPTCTRNDVLAAGNSYPAITVTVSVAGDATSPQVNSISVTTAQAESNTGNNTATDSTLVAPGEAPREVEAIPTLSEWAMIVIGLLLAALAAFHLRRRSSSRA